MEIAGMALAILGYALFYTGASNLFTGGKGWGFQQSLLNKGEANSSGAIPNTMPGGSSGKGSTNPFSLGNLWDTAGKLIPFLGA